MFCLLFIGKLFVLCLLFIGKLLVLCLFIVYLGSYLLCYLFCDCLFVLCLLIIVVIIQAALVRELKAQGGDVSKETIDSEVKKLLELKEKLGISPAKSKKAKKNKTKS